MKAKRSAWPRLNAKPDRAIYREAVREVTRRILEEVGAWQAHVFLLELEAAERRAREERRIANLQPVATVLGRMPSGPRPNWTDEGKRAAAVVPRSGDFVRVLPPQPAKKRAQRVLNPDAPDAETLAERQCARTNKF